MVGVRSEREESPGEIAFSIHVEMNIMNDPLGWPFCFHSLV